MSETTRKFLEGGQIVVGAVPADFSASASPTFDWVSLKDFQRCLCLFIAGAGSAGADSTIRMQQATAVAGTGAKDLTFTRLDVKQGASLAAIGQFTAVTQTAAANYTSATSGESELVWAVDIGRPDLDIANDFDCIRMTVDDHAAYKAGTVVYVLYNPRKAVDPSLSAIAD